MAGAVTSLHVPGHTQHCLRSQTDFTHVCWGFQIDVMKEGDGFRARQSGVVT